MCKIRYKSQIVVRSLHKDVLVELEDLLPFRVII